MAEIEVSSVPAIAVTAVVGAIVLLFVFLCNVVKKADPKEEEAEEKTEQNGEVKAKRPAQTKKKAVNVEKNKRDVKHTFTHPWLASKLGGHSSSVLGIDFSPNGKYLVSCSEDRSFMLWSVKEFDHKEHKFIRGNVELDHATQIKFSPDNRALILNLFQGSTVRVMKIGKKADNSPGNFQSVLDFEKTHGHKAEIAYLGISCSGRFIMTSSKDTVIKIWDLKGEVLATIDTLQVNNSYAAVSPCGRFVACSGFTTNVKVWEVGFDKSGNFQGITRAFELKGHSAGVHSFAFSEGSTKMATVSKDGTWKVWDTDIRYDQGQDPYLIGTGQHQSPHYSLISLSLDGRTVAIASDCTITMYNAITTERVVTFENAHTSCVTALSFDLSSKHLVSAGGKHIQVFHNVVGHRAVIVELEEKRKKISNTAQRERMQQQINEARQSLEAIESGDTSS